MGFPKPELPELIYRTSSEYNEKIEVYKVGDKLRLSVNGIVQSISANTPSVTRRIWGRTVELVKNQKPNAEEILILGLGGGTMPSLFAKEMPNVKITAVEIDSEMIDVAEKYFDIKLLNNLTVINSNALRVLSEPESFGLEQSQFDVIVVDTYCGSKYPDLGNSGSFFAGLRRLAKIQGLIVFNRIYVQQFQNKADQFYEVVCDYFKDVNKLTVAGRTNSDNLLIYGTVIKQ